MYTIMFWVSKQEMRVVKLNPGPYSPIFEFEEVPGAPIFDDPEIGWQWIRDNYPEYQP